MAKPTEQELLDKISQLEAENSALQDKLDLIYSIVAPDDASGDEESGDEGEDGLVQIRNVN